MNHKFKFKTFKFRVNHYVCEHCGKTLVAVNPSDYVEEVRIANTIKCKDKSK